MEFKTHPKTKIGHIHLTVSDLERSLKFYRDILGFEITSFYGDQAVFLSAGGYHHHIGLNTWAGESASPPPDGHSGLYHFAILYPDRKELAKVVRRLYEFNYKTSKIKPKRITQKEMAVFISHTQTLRKVVFLICGITRGFTEI